MLEGEPEDAPKKYVYDLTLQEVREHFSKTKEYKDSFAIVGRDFVLDDPELQIPTLDSIFELFDRQSTVNVEAKCPKDPARRPNYNAKRLIEILGDTI